MARGSPQARPLRAVLAVLAGTLVLLVTMAVPSNLGAQTQEGTVRLTPAISSIPEDSGSFTVFLVLEDLQHFGSLSYDGDRDTVPDRFVESAGLAAFEITIEYDPELLSFVDVQEGPDLGRTGRLFSCLPPARDLTTLVFGCVSPGPEPAGPQGTLTLATVTFEPLAAGSSALVVSAQLSGPLGSDTVPVDVRGGVARIMARPGTKTTPSPGVATSTTIIDNGATPGSGTVTSTPQATADATDATPGAPETSTRPSNTRTPVVNGDPGDGSGDSTGFPWLGATLGGIAAAVALGLAAAFWQRRHRAGT